MGGSGKGAVTAPADAALGASLVTQVVPEAEAEGHQGLFLPLEQQDTHHFERLRMIPHALYTWQSQAPPKAFKLLTKSVWRCAKPKHWALRTAGGAHDVASGRGERGERGGSGVGAVSGAGASAAGKADDVAAKRRQCEQNMAMCIECDTSSCGAACPNQR